MSEPFYDEELMVRDLETLFKAKLNTEIGLINTEKGAVSGNALFMEDINSNKYIFESLHKSALNFKGFFILFGLVDTPIKEQNIESFLEDVVVQFEVATFDNGEKERSSTMYKLLRYRRALKQVIIKNPEVFRGYAKPLLASLKPSAFPYDSKNIVLLSGITVKALVTAS